MAKRASVKSPSSFPPDTRVGVVHGPDSYLREEKVRELREALEAEHGEIEVITLDGRTASLADVLDEVRGFSLMVGYKLVVVDAGDVFLSGKSSGAEDDAETDGSDDDGPGSGGSSRREPMERYIQSPVDHATLILRSEAWRPGKIDKLIGSVCPGAVIKCEHMQPAEAIAWVQARAGEKFDGKIEPRAAAGLVERIGTDLRTLDTELGKLCAAAGQGVAVSVRLVEELIGRTSEEQAFEIQEALLQALLNGPGNAIEQLHEVIELSGQPKVLVGFFVTDLARKLYIGAQLKAQGVSDFEIAKEARMWGERARTFSTVLRKLSVAQASRMFDQAVRMDVRSKTGFGESSRAGTPPRGLECLTVDLCAIYRG